MGRTRKTAREAKLDGTDRAKSVTNRTMEHVAKPGRPKMPSTLSPVAKTLWRKIVDHLDRTQILNSIDATELEMLCRTWVRWRNATAVCEKHGESVLCHNAKGEVTNVRRRPESTASIALGKQVLEIGAKFGLSPRDRAHIDVDLPAPSAVPEGGGGTAGVIGRIGGGRAS